MADLTFEPVGDVLLDQLVTPPALPGPFQRGLRQGVASLVAPGYGAKALGARVLGAESTEANALAQVQATQQAAAPYQMKVEDVSSPGDALDFAKYALGSVIPSSVALLGGAVAGRFGGKALASRFASEAAKRMLINTGTLGGAFAGSFGLEAGSIFPEAVEEGVGSPVARSLAGGAVAGALDTAAPAFLLRRLGVLGAQTAPLFREAGLGAVAKGAGTALAKTAAIEGITEATQSLIERAAAGKNLRDAEAISDYINSGAIGAIGGGAIGGGVGGVQTALTPIARPVSQIENDRTQIANTPTSAGAPTTQPEPVPPLPSLFANDDILPLPDLLPGDQPVRNFRTQPTRELASPYSRSASPIAAEADETRRQTLEIQREAITARLASLDAEASAPRKKGSRAAEAIAADRKAAQDQLLSQGLELERLNNARRTREILAETPSGLGPRTAPQGAPVALGEGADTTPAERGLAEVKRAGGFLVSSREAQLAPLTRREQALQVVQQRSARESSRQVDEQTRRGAIEAATVESVKRHVAEAAGVFRKGTEQRVRNDIINAAVAASSAPTIEAAQAQVKAAVLKNVVGNVNKADADTLAASIAADVAKAPTFYSRGAINEGVELLNRAQELRRGAEGLRTRAAKMTNAERKAIYLGEAGRMEREAKFLELRGEITKFSKGAVDDGTVTFMHWGNVPTGVLDPSRIGTGVAGADQPLARAVGAQYASAVIAGSNYSEPRVQSQQMYVGKIPQDKIYVARRDDPLFDKAKADLQAQGIAFPEPGLIWAQYGKLVQAQGYDAIQFANGQLRIFSPVPVVQASNAATVASDPLAYVPQIMLAHQVTGGSTTNLVTGEDLAGTPNYAVAVYKDREVKILGQPSEEDVRSFIEDNAEVLMTPGHTLGTWYNPDDGYTYIDISITTPSMQAALDVGRRNAQLAIFNLQTFETIPVDTNVVLDLAHKYAAAMGLPPAVQHATAPIDAELGTRVAAAYENLQVRNDAPAVQDAYRALAAETRAQFDFLVANGFRFTRTQEQPYGGFTANNEQQWRTAMGAMRKDVLENKHLYVSDENVQHPFMSDEENWMFRAVHDVFGHVKYGYGFGNQGEYNTFLAHAMMYTDAALPALATETTGQDMWVWHSGTNVNVGAQLAFPTQKADLLPQSLLQELLAPVQEARQASVDKFDAIQARKGKALIARLTEMVGHDPYLQVQVFRAEGGSGIGSYTRLGPLGSLITMATNAADELSIADHEGYHYAEDRILDASERAVITRAFRPGGSMYNALIAKAQAYDRAHGTDITSEIASIPEEARAYGFEFWRRGEIRTEPKTALERVFQKLAQFFERIVNLIRLNGFQSLEDVFDALAKGQYAQRERNKLYGELKATPSDTNWAADVEPDVVPGVTIREREGDAASKAKGRPEWVQSAADVKTLRARLRKLALEGELARNWHADSGQAVMRWAAGDAAKAAKMAALISNYSPRTPVGQDLKKALTAWYQYEAGQKIDPGAPKEHNAGALRILSGNDKTGKPAERDDAGNVRPTGIKRDNFYKNLMQAIDAENYSPMKQGATIDMWMAHAFEFANDVSGSVSKQQYNYADAEVKRLARELGWTVEETQAAIWVAIKARGNSTRGLIKQHAMLNGWLRAREGGKEEYDLLGTTIKSGKYEVRPDREAAFVHKWMELSLINPVSQAELEKAAYNYANAFEDIYSGKLDLSARVDDLPFVVGESKQDSYEMRPQPALFSRGAFEATFDAKDGLGAVPWNQDVDYLGFVRKMTPSEFLAQAATLHSPKDRSMAHIRETLEKGGALGQPFLIVDWNDETRRWDVVGHEGRHRMTALMEKAPEQQVPVHIFPRSPFNRSRVLTDEMKAAPLMTEDSVRSRKLLERSQSLIEQARRNDSTLYSQAATAAARDMNRRMQAGELEREQVMQAVAAAIDEANLPDTTFKQAFGAAKDQFVGGLQRWRLEHLATGNYISRFSSGYANVQKALLAYVRRKSTLISEGSLVGLSEWHDGASQDDITAVGKALFQRTTKGLIDGSPEYLAVIGGLTDKQKRMFEQATFMIASRLQHEFDVDQRTFAQLLPAQDYAKWLDQRGTQVQKLIAEGYVPERRYGDYTVHIYTEATDARGRPQKLTLQYEQFENEAQAKLQAARYKEILDREAPELKVDTGYRYRAERDTSISIQQFLDTARRHGIELTQAERERLAKALVAADSTRRNRIFHRKNVPGYSEDIMRVLHEFVVTTANKVAYAEFSPAINAALVGQPVDARTERGVPKIEVEQRANLWVADGPNSGFFRNLADDLTDYVLVPDHTGEWSKNLRGAAMMYFIGGSLASGAVNAMSIPMNTVPWLSQYTNYAGAVSTTFSAYGTTLKNQDVLRNIPALKDLNNRIPAIDNVPGLREALIIASENGVTLDTEIHQIMGLSQGSLLAKSRKVQKAAELWMAPFRFAEQTNRIATFISGYRIGLENGLQGRALYDFATDAVDNTQNRYDEVNRPGLARSPVWALMFMFKSFPMFMIEMIEIMYRQNPKSAVYMLLGLTAMTGVHGFPFAEPLMDLIDTISQRLFGSSFNTRRAIRNLAKDASEAIVGADLSELVLRGVINDMTGLNIGSRVGLGDFVPGTRLGTADNDYARTLEQTLGAPVAMIADTLKAAGQVAKGDWLKAMREGGPTMVRNLVKANEQLDRGYAVDAKDRKLIDVTGPEVFWQALGFTSAGLHKAYELDKLDRQSLAFYRQAREDFTNRLTKAIRDGDAVKAQETMTAMQKWNESNPSMPIALSGASIRRNLVDAGLPLNERTLRNLPRELRGTSVAIEGIGQDR